MAKPVRISTDLEYSLVFAIIGRRVSPDIVTEGELSKEGKLVVAAVVSLGGATEAPSLRDVFLAATEVLGGDREVVKAYLSKVKEAGETHSVVEILQMVRDKQALVEIINSAGTQLSKGRLDVGAIQTILATETARGRAATIVPMAEAIKDGLPPKPEGIRLLSLPTIVEHGGGMYGLWVVAGEPGVGKSCLAWQVALDVAREIPAIYFSLENTFAELAEHTSQIFEGDLARIRQATERIYVRESIRTLEADLNSVPAPALVVIDHMQKLPRSITHDREGLEAWTHRLQDIAKKRGYHVLAISEVPRGAYERDPSLADFKGSGEIEYSADLGFRMMPHGDDGVDIFIVKNRHHRFKGYAVGLRRVRNWWFRESD